MGVSPRRLQGWEPAEVTVYLREDPKHPSWVTRSVTVREPEFSRVDAARLFESWTVEHEPRGSHGIPLVEATDPANHPLSPTSRGRFVAEPVFDFAQQAIDEAVKKRRESMQNPDDDFAKIWRVHFEEAPTPPSET